MILLHLSDMGQLPKDTPKAVSEKIREQLAILDSEYGSERTIEDDGGYVLYIRKDEYCHKLLEEIDIDFGMAEYVEILSTDKCEYIVALWLFNNDFSVVVIVSKEQVPQRLLVEI